jgi:hypothetical protein
MRHLIATAAAAMLLLQTVSPAAAAASATAPTAGAIGSLQAVGDVDPELDFSL